MLSDLWVLKWKIVEELLRDVVSASAERRMVDKVSLLPYIGLFCYAYDLYLSCFSFFFKVWLSQYFNVTASDLNQLTPAIHNVYDSRG